MVSREATNTKFIFFGLTRSGLEPMIIIYSTRGEHTNHYTTHAVHHLICCFTLSINNINWTLNEVPMYDIFVKLTFINWTPVYSQNKSWSQGFLLNYKNLTNWLHTLIIGEIIIIKFYNITLDLQLLTLELYQTQGYVLPVLLLP